MPLIFREFAAIEGLSAQRDVPLKEHTRFALGGPAAVLADAATEDAFIRALRTARAGAIPVVVIGGGSNVVVSDAGFDGVVLRYTAGRVQRQDGSVLADAGAELQTLINFSIGQGLAGLHTMTGIPGWVGGAVYGNAGAYGRSIHESVTRVRFFDGVQVREISNAECGFRYRHSAFKEHKEWIVFSAEFALTPGDASELQRSADEILAIRNSKYPQEMKCAGSIFKNLILAELPAHVQRLVDPKVVREGKVPSAYFLEQAGAKGMRHGGIEVAPYHANLIYNLGHGTAHEVREVIDELKRRVRDRFQFEIEEEVQYIGF